jgi:pyruvate formate lyase activating enzyme
VLQTCELAKQLGIHIELTYLVIPGLNDDRDEVKQFCHWIGEKLGVDVPVHFSRFHPDYQMTSIPATPMDTLLGVYTVAKDAGLQYVYLGNIPHGDYENTVCPSCKALLVERQGYSAQVQGIVKGKCARCGTLIPLRME